jgi:signal transduction histidine kinase
MKYKLLEFVRMDTGEWRNRLQKINIGEFLKSFARRISLDAELFHHHTAIDIRLPPDLYVPLDERLTVRALENLVNNAIRYTPGGTTIRLGAAMAENAIRVTISDNGPGIGIGSYARPYFTVASLAAFPSRLYTLRGLAGSRKRSPW